MKIETSVFGSLPVIVFKNHALNKVDAHICTDPATAGRELARMEKMEHIEIIAVTDAVVKTASDR